VTDTEFSPQTIALIGGTGNLGPGLALRWAKAGHTVFIGSRTSEKAEEVASELNEILGDSLILGLDNASAVQRAEICVLTVVQSAHDPALESLKEELQGKILIDATARTSFPDLTPPAPPSAARIAQNILGKGVRVTAAFQNVAASSLKKNLGEQLNSDVIVCADDLEAAQTVIALSKSAGMQAYYAGDLDKAIVVEGFTSLVISMNKHYKVHAGTIKIAGIPSSKT
jgi:hypothetical protein